MKVLGIDYGTKRIGLALSDESATLARELSILSPKQFWNDISALVRDEQVEKIVVGLPLNMSGEDSNKTREVRDFAQRLGEQCGLPVHLMDERLSSVMAQQAAGSAEGIDSLAAQIILQNYLNSQGQ